MILSLTISLFTLSPLLGLNDRSREALGSERRQNCKQLSKNHIEAHSASNDPSCAPSRLTTNSTSSLPDTTRRALACRYVEKTPVVYGNLPIDSRVRRQIPGYEGSLPSNGNGDDDGLLPRGA